MKEELTRDRRLFCFSRENFELLYEMSYISEFHTMEVYYENQN